MKDQLIDVLARTLSDARGKDHDIRDRLGDVLERALSLKDFMFLENMSPATYYKIRRAGNGPEETVLPGTNLIRITAEARRAWHAKLAALRDSTAGKLEQQRRDAQAKQAAKVAVASPDHVSKRKRSEAR
jgi:hypothetical protein